MQNELWLIYPTQLLHMTFFTKIIKWFIFESFLS